MNNPDPLQKLWQQQDVSLPDIDSIRARWRRDRLSQIGFILLDIIGLAVAFYAGYYLFYVKQDVHWLMHAWMIAMLVIVLVLTPYSLWMRRFTLVGRQLSTAEHLQRMRHQHQQNIALVRLGRWLLIVVATGSLLLVFGLWYLDNAPLMKIIRTSAFLAVSGSLYWWWSGKHIKKCHQQLQSLSALLRQTTYN